MTLDTTDLVNARGANPVLGETLAELDPAIHRVIVDELMRQQSTLEMIARENFAPLAVMQAQGSVLTNKLRRGLPRPAVLRRVRARRRQRAAGHRSVPFDPRPPMISSGVRIGTAALATRGFDLEAFGEVADIISHALRPDTDEGSLSALRDRVDVLTQRFPLYPNLTEASL